MEIIEDFGPNKPSGFTRRMAGSIIAGLQFVRHQLALLD